MEAQTKEQKMDVACMALFIAMVNLEKDAQALKREWLDYLAEGSLANWNFGCDGDYDDYMYWS